MSYEALVDRLSGYTRVAEDRDLLDSLENTIANLKKALELGHIEAAQRLAHDAEGLLEMYRWG